MFVLLGLFISCVEQDHSKAEYYFNDTANVIARSDFEMYEDLDTLYLLKDTIANWKIMFNEYDTAAVKYKKFDTTFVVNFWRANKIKLLEKYFRDGRSESAFCENGRLIKRMFNGEICPEYYCNGKEKCSIFNTNEVVWYREDGSIFQRGRLDINKKLLDTLWLYDDSSRVVSFELYKTGILQSR